MKININGNVLEVSDDVIQQALSNKKESIDIKSDDLVIRTSEKQAEYEANIKKEVGDHKVEIGRKEVLLGLGLDIEGKGFHKSVDKSVEAVNSFVSASTSKALEEAGKEPNSKIKELTQDLETLRGNLSEKDAALLSAQEEFSGFKNKMTINNSLNKELSKFNDINNQDNRLLIFNSKVKTGLDENGIVRGYDNEGNVMKDNDRNPLTLEAVVNNYYDNNPDALQKAEGGAGGGDSKGGGNSNDWESFVKRQEDAGNSPASEEFAIARDAAIKNGSLVM